MNRRQFLATSAAALAASSAPRLAIAQTAPRQFDLTAGRIDKALYPEGGNSSLWAYNLSVPGPEIRVAKGDRIKVKFRNELEEPTSIHWHGIRITNAMDGVSGLTQEPVQPGEEFIYEFDVPDAGTYWYHAHNKSWNQVGRGLYGPLIIDEPEGPFDAAHDLTLVIDDWRLTAPGVLDEESFGSMMDWSHGGRLGNWITVNGEAGPSFKLQAAEAYRMRLVNAANARVLEFDLNSFGAKVLAYDGQALPHAQELDYSPFMLGPSQRVDLLVVPQKDFTLDALFDEGPFPLAEFKVAGEVNAAAAIAALPMNDLPEPDLANARRVQVVMEGGAMGGFVDITYKGEKLEGEAFPRTKQSWGFNGIANLAEDPLFAAKAGETIIIETVNKTAWVHAMHVHGHHFRVLSRSGAEVDEGQPWRDTFLIGGEQTTEIAFVADNPGRWLYHCHMLEHAAAGMNTWFNIT